MSGKEAENVGRKMVVTLRVKALKLKSMSDSLLLYSLPQEL